MFADEVFVDEEVFLLGTNTNGEYATRIETFNVSAKNSYLLCQRPYLKTSSADFRHVTAIVGDGVDGPN